MCIMCFTERNVDVLFAIISYRKNDICTDLENIVAVGISST